MYFILIDTLLTIILADNKQISSITSKPFSIKVFPLSTISTIQSAKPTIAPSSTDPFNLIISTFLFLLIKYFSVIFGYFVATLIYLPL